MLLESVFHTDEHNHEHVPMTSAGMPYICIHTEMDRFPDRKIAWHWHNALEFVVVEEGTTELRVPDQRLLLSPGMAAFVNSGVLHEYSSVGNVMYLVVCTRICLKHSFYLAHITAFLKKSIFLQSVVPGLYRFGLLLLRI
ncbi:MAG: cupin domain-containing protein [Blautia sp.]|nr:cupin domain-containing protein [Blautia sp.]